MFKSKGIFIIALMLTIFFSSAFLFACNKDKNVPVVVEAGENGTIEKINDGGNDFYIASPDDWYMFVGWFDGNRKYSENPNLKITKNTPKKLKARFTTTATLSFDRIFNSLYNSYKTGINARGEYFNFLGEGVFKFNQVENNLSLGGSLNFLGKGNQIYLKSKGKNNFSFIYNDNLTNGCIYLEKNDEKIAFNDMGLLSNFFKSLPNPGENNWNVENVLNNEYLYYQFDQYFGYLNAFGLVSSVSNTSNKTELTISFNKLLTLLKNFYNSFPEGSVGKDLIDVLIGCYEEGNFPKITIKITVNYKGDESENIKDLEIDCSIDRDYYLNIGQEGLVIPQGNINFKLNNLKYGFSDELNKVGDDELNSYPISEQKMVNAHIDGNLYFIEEGEEDSVIDNYTIEFDADLNPLALLVFKNEEMNLNNIEWEKLGFLSFRVVLKPSNDENIALEQYSRHKGSTDYINILIDTKKFGAKVFVYAACYNPATLFSSSYLINNSFDLPGLLSYNTSKATLEREGIDNENANILAISKLIKSLLNLNLNIDENNLSKSFYEIISSFLSEKFNTHLYLEEEKIIIDVENIRNEIRELEKENGLTLAGNPIKTDKYLFGDDKISKVELRFESFSKNTVKKDINGNYLDKNGDDITGAFNKKHTLVTDILAVVGEEEFTLDELSNLKGSSIVASEFMLSDGSQTDKYIDCDGNNVNLSLKVQNVIVGEEESGEIEVKLILFINSPTHTVITLTNSISNILYEYFKIPYGLFEYSIKVKVS